MTAYLDKTFDWETDRIADIYDELPFWSSGFGRLLLENFPIKKYRDVLDLGFGSGFPLIEIAQRLGNGCKVTGVDLWEAASRRAQKKIEVLGIGNVEIIKADAAELPFENESVDLVVSNVGVNNFDNAPKVLQECHRVLKANGTLCITSNLTGTFDQFYTIFESTLREMELVDTLSDFEEHVAHRGTVESVENNLQDAGFKVERVVRDEMKMRLVDGSAFLNHAFVILGFIEPWKNLISSEKQTSFFERLESNLNSFATYHGELCLTVPMAYFESKKQSS